MSNPTLIDVKNRINSRCTDIRALMLTWTENQREQYECVRNLYLNSLYCCDLSTSGILDFEEGDAVTPVPIVLFDGENVNKYQPVFKADDEDLGQLQPCIDEQKFSSCVNSLKAQVTGRISTPDFHVSGNTPTGPIPVRLNLVFNIFCYDGSVQTVSVPLDVNVVVGETTGFMQEVDIPFLYERGECDMDNLRILYNSASNITATPTTTGLLPIEIASAEVTYLEMEDVVLRSVCFHDESCFLSLLTMIPKTGTCFDPRLFFVGYHHNQEIIKNLLEKVQRNYSKCCDDSFGISYTLCDSKEDIVGENPYVMVLEDDSGTDIVTLMANNNLETCNLDISYIATLCTNGFFNSEAEDAYTSTWKVTVDYFAGVTLLDSRDIVFNTFHASNSNPTGCTTLTIPFERTVTQFNQTGTYFQVRDITFLYDDSDRSATERASFSSWTTNSVCADAICFEIED